MIKITKTGKDYKLVITDKAKRRIEYLMTEKEYKAIVLKGWEDYIKQYCIFARLFCKYNNDVKKYTDKFCEFVEKVCVDYTFTIKRKRK